MLIKTTFLLAALSGLAFAQSDSDSEALADLQSYVAGLQTDPAFLSVVSALATDPAALSSIQAFETSALAALQTGGSVDADFADDLPTQARSLFLSIYAAETSILGADGAAITDAPTPGETTAPGETTTPGETATPAATGTSTTSGNAAPTGAALGLSAGALAGFVGVVMAL